MPCYLALNPRVEEEWVEVAHVSKGIHPVTRKPVDLTLDKFKSWADYLSYLKEKNSSSPLATNHSVLPTDRLGSVKDWRIHDNGFWIKPGWSSPEIKEKVKEASFSVYSSPNAVTFEGREFPHALVHVGVTDYPVLKGLRKRTGDPTLILSENVSTEKDMDLLDTIVLEKDDPSKTPKEPEKKETRNMKEIALLLGLVPDASEAAILAELRKLQEAHRLSSTQLSEAVGFKTKFATALVADRKERVSKLPAEQQKKFTKFCTEDCVLSDLGNPDSLFETALSMAQELLAETEKEEEEEEKFSSEDQGAGHAHKDSSVAGSSLVAHMAKLAKASRN